MTMRIVTGHQPVYLPWLGLFHKVSLADVYVFMDDVQYLTQDWNNRNKVRGRGEPFWLTVPVSLKRSESKLLKDIRIVSDGWGGKGHWQNSHWIGMQSAYRKTPFWDTYAGFFEDVYTQKPWEWLSELCEYMLRHFLDVLDIQVEFIKGSEQAFDAKKSDLVLEHCKRFEADICVLGMHGRDYLNVDSFMQENVSVHFQGYEHPEYSQLGKTFAPYMSVPDLLFNCGPESRDILLSGNVTRGDLEREAQEHGPCVLGEGAND